MKNFLGQNGFIWWFGVVEDINDPVQLGRVRVRCIGWHTDDKDKIPTESLPWAIPMFDTQSASRKGVGESPTGLLVGSWVLGFFVDGARAQEPAVLASISGSYILGEDTAPKALVQSLQKFDEQINNDGSKSLTDDSGEVVVEQSATIDGLTQYKHLKDNEFGKAGTTTVEYVFSGGRTYKTVDTDTRKEVAPQSLIYSAPTLDENRVPDINALARGVQTKPYVPDSVISEPADPYAAEYPYNKVRETESGHVKEYDDTPDKERIRELHKSGTFYQVHPDGSVSTHIVKDNYTVIAGNDSVHVTGNVKLVVDGNVDADITGYLRMNIGETCDITSGKNMTLIAPEIHLNP